MTQATYLTIGIEPDTDIHSSSIIKARFKEIFELAESWAGSETLRYADIYCTKIYPAVWKNWMECVDLIAPEEWQPKSFGPVDDKDDVHGKRRGELLKAAEKGLESGELLVGPTIKELLQYMGDGDYQNCNNTTYEAIQKSIERTGAKLFDDASYSAAVDRHTADKTDKQ